MALPELIDVVKIKEWIPDVSKHSRCYLHDFNAMGITPEQFASVISGRKAYLFEKPFSEKVHGKNCPWCEFKRDKSAVRGQLLLDHIFSHPKKTVLSYQLIKFQKELYTLRLQLVRQGYHECMPLFVEHSCQDCLNPVLEGREGMCVFPVSPRSRMRSLKVLGYPIKHLVSHKKRKYKWSALGVIVLIKTE